MTALFPLGSIVATPGALDALDAARVDPLVLLSRHASGDWGNVPEEDAAENRHSVENNYRIISAYRLSMDVQLWVITEADRSVTTLLLPSEY